MTEYLVVLVMLLVALVAGALVLTKYPDWSNKALLIAVAGSLIAGLSWAVKQSISVVNSRAQLFVFELLSKNDPQGLTRAEIETALRSEHSVFKVVPGLALDALAHLVGEKVVTAKDGRFRLQEKKP